MVRHTDTPQGLAYRDGSGLACVLADFGSAKMLQHPLMLNAAATEHEPISKMWWPTLRPALWLSRGFCQLPGVRPASTISRLGRALAGQIQVLRLTYRHESTAAAACAAPSIPYVCTRPYRAPELFYGAECYRGEPDGTRACARVRECLLPSIRPCVLLFVRARACVLTCAPGAYTTPSPPCPPPPPSRSVVPRLLALRRPAAQQLAQTKGPPTLLAPQQRLPCGARRLCTLQRCDGASAHRLTARCHVLLPIGVASSSSMPRVSTATRCT